ncbi:MAG: hypothetical protein ACK5FW_09840, partial [Acidimicrobiaceae bacterium]
MSPIVPECERQTDEVTNTATDLEWGNFSESGPWNLDRDSISWSRVAIVLRDQAQAEVPRLIRARKLPPLKR